MLLLGIGMLVLPGCSSQGSSSASVTTTTAPALTKPVIFHDIEILVPASYRVIPTSEGLCGPSISRVINVGPPGPGRFPVAGLFPTTSTGIFFTVSIPIQTAGRIITTINGLSVEELASPPALPYVGAPVISSLHVNIPSYDASLSFWAPGRIRDGALRLAYAILATAHAVGPPPTLQALPHPNSGAPVRPGAAV